MPLETLLVATDPAGLGEALAMLDDLPSVGVDVERADWNRYYRAAALIQVGGEGRVAVVDPMTLEDLAPLSAFLATRVTVLHAMENDLGPLATAGVRPGPVEDTSLAAAVLGLPMGLEALLRDLLGIELEVDKQAMQRADWEARPLPEEMLAYAAGDVADLPALWEELAAQLEETGREQWYRQEMAAALALPSVEERRDWTRTKGAGRLPVEAQARLRALWCERERLARETNTAPGRILPDKLLAELALHPPAGVGELSSRGMRRQAIRTFGAALLAVLNEPLEEVVARERQRAPSEADRGAADRLRTARARRAAELGIDPGVLCPSRTLMGAVLSDPASPEELEAALGLRAWQWEQLAEDFCAVLDLDAAGRVGE